MKKVNKIVTAAILSLGMSVIPAMSGCIAFTAGGKDGKDGQDVSIYEIYEATNTEREKEGLEKLTFLDFVKEYLNYTSDEAEQFTSLQTCINRSLLSSVAIFSTYTVKGVSQSYAGSGVILDVDKEKGDMTVVTNAHVVYEVTAAGDHYCDDVALYLYGNELFGSKKIEAKIAGVSKSYDIAVLKVSGSSVVKSSGAIAAKWAEEEELYLGGSVYAIGNPRGEKLSATQGVISYDSEWITIDLENTSLTMDDYEYRVLRTDAAINGGNSGGGLFNTKGELVGIVNAKTVQDEIDNMGYALPASTSKRIVKNILYNYNGTETHGIYRALLGITSQVVERDAYYDNNLNVVRVVETMEISKVNFGSMAYGKLKEGDILKHIKVESSSGYVREDMDALRQYNVSDAMLSVRSGDKVTVTVEREGKTIDVVINYGSSGFEYYA